MIGFSLFKLNISRSSNLMDPNHVLKEYREAELFGQRSEKDHDACKNQYKGCPFSVFKIVKLTSLFEK